MRKDTLLFYIAIISISSSQLYLEVSLTRIFSITQGYHWAFLVVGLALLGSGLSGTCLVFRKGLYKNKGIEHLRVLSIIYPLSIILAYLEITLLQFDPYVMPWSRVQFLFFFLNLTSFLVPFFFSGLIISLSLILFSERHSTLYCMTFIGSSIGSIITLFLIPITDEFGAILVCALLGFLSSILLCRDDPKYYTIPSALFLFSLYVLIYRPFNIPLKLSPYKDMAQILRLPDTEILETHRNVNSRIDIVESPTIRYAPGLSYKYRGRPPSGLGLTVDGENLKGIITSNHFTDYLPQTVVYLLKETPEVLIIEPVGGLDLMLAMNRGVKNINVLFEDPVQIDILKRYLHDTSQVNFIVEHPRVYLSQSRELFDIIHFPLGESFYVITSGSYSLKENYIYTVEGFKSSYSRLNPDGMLLFTRWLQRPPTEELKLFNIILTGLRELGIGDPENRIVAFRSLNTMTFIVKKGDLIYKEIEIIKRFTGSMSFDFVFLDGLTPIEANRYNVLPDDIYYRYFQELFYNSNFSDIYPFRIDPPRDDKPFFFHFFKIDQIDAILKNWGHTWQPFGGAGYIVIMTVLSLIILISFIFIILPFLIDKTKPPKTYRVSNFSFYFFIIGLAYMFVEIPIMQRLILYLGKPVYSFSLTLSLLLIFSGIGSSLAIRLKKCPVLFILGSILLLLSFLISSVIEKTLGYPFYCRVIISTVMIGLSGFLMGMPFPLALEKAKGHSVDIIPWCWAINGFASVLSSFLSTILAIHIGFTAILAIGGTLYLLAGLILTLTPDKRNEQDVS